MPVAVSLRDWLAVVGGGARQRVAYRSRCCSGPPATPPVCASGAAVAQPRITTAPSAGPVNDDAPPAWRDRPSTLMVMPMRAAEQHVLVVVGEADLHTAEQLRSQLIGALGTELTSVLVELGALDFCDLQGLDALHDAARAAHDAGIALTFRGMSRQLSWLHRTFPAPDPPPPGLTQPVPATPTAVARSTPTPARTADQPSGRNATPEPQQRPASPSTPRIPASSSSARPDRRSAVQRPVRPGGRADTGRFADPRGSPDKPREDYRTGRGGGRRGAPDNLLHAVPTSDTTRSALCGAQTRPATTPWTGAGAGSCPDCAAAVAGSLAAGTAHHLPGSPPTAGLPP